MEQIEGFTIRPSIYSRSTHENPPHASVQLEVNNLIKKLISLQWLVTAENKVIFNFQTAFN